ncbi:glutathione S-transferase family protein [Lutibaculum baratangense]|uniref:Glutathione S-transferase n=1 Tax=Lutibaculum baratangense AMV1 TaxID=631454 RepID=V4TBK4_9HYPH|nr:glutathione S-transferase N-terminal domain-containing protein [Lutibaculum baratangense]ESR23778.1 Glutathione S-transferase [Lutibaculum baratangense AMV1]
MADMRLHGSLTSPYVRKVRIVIAETGLDCHFVVTDVWAPDNGIERLNPLGRVPVLEIDGLEPLFDSFTILEHLDRCHGLGLLRAGDERDEAMRWHALGHGVIDAVVARLLELRRPPELRSADRMAREEERVARTLAAMERMVKTGGELFPDRIGLAEVTVATALQYVDFRFRHEWREYAPELAAVGDRGSILSTMPA